MCQAKTDEQGSKQMSSAFVAFTASWERQTLNSSKSDVHQALQTGLGLNHQLSLTSCVALGKLVNLLCLFLPVQNGR